MRNEPQTPTNLSEAKAGGGEVPAGAQAPPREPASRRSVASKCTRLTDLFGDYSEQTGSFFG